MKYPQLVSSTTPASLRDWLEEELESRGIDGVYTRYILSLLQQDSLDLDLPECDHLTKLQQKCPLQVGGKEQTSLHLAKSRHRRWKSWERERLHKPDSCNFCSCGLALNYEERRKTAAVECLKSASEQKYGIEKLIDELCTKLKKIDSPEDAIQNGTSNTSDFDNADIELKSIPHASPQEQAEKYYAAFPALSGKTEPLTKLCHQQERRPAFRSVWDGQHVIRHTQEYSHSNEIGDEECIDFLTDRKQKHEDSSDRESNASEKENEIYFNENSGGWIGKKNRKSGEKIKEAQFGQSGSQKPSFIIPKMKTAAQRVPFTVKHSPFNLSVTKQTSTAKIWVDTRKVKECIRGRKDVLSTPGTDGNVSFQSDHILSYSEPLASHCEDIINKLLEESVVELCDVDGPLVHCCPFRNVLEGCTNELGLVLSSSVSGVQQHCSDDMVTQLIDKFDNSLAAIWGSGGVISTESSTFWAETSGSLSFTVFPLKSAASEVADKEDGSTSSTSIYSVWSVGGEDLEVFKLPETVDVLSKAHSPKPHSLAAGIVSGVLNGLQLNKNTDLNISPISETFSSFNNSVTPNADELLDLREDLEQILSICPGSHFTNLDECNEQYPFERSSANGSPAESVISSNKGIYTLWECSSPDLHLTLGINTKTPRHSFLIDQSSSEWQQPGHQHVGNEDSSGALCDQVTSEDELTGADCFGMEKTNYIWNLSTNKQSPSKRNCTLLYHKGESRFVEVVPSSKSRHFAAEKVLSPQCDGQEKLKNSCSEGESEAEENLLTSSKTHFQPIRQDSTETESGDSEVTSLVETSRERKHGFIRDPSDEEPDPPVSHRTTVEHQSNKDIQETASLSPLSECCSSDSSSRSSFKVLKVRNRALSSSYDELMSLMGPLGTEENTTPRSSCPSSPESPEVPLFTWKLETYKDKSTNTESSIPGTLTSIHSNMGCRNYQKFQKTVLEQVLKTFTEDEAENWDLELLDNEEINLPSWRTDWSLADDDQYSWIVNNKSSSCTHLNDSQEFKGGDSGSCSSNYEPQNLKALRKEIEEEEEQLFRDINRLADNSVDICGREGFGKDYSVEEKKTILEIGKKDVEATNILNHTEETSSIYGKHPQCLTSSWEDNSAVPLKQFSTGQCKDEDFTQEAEDSDGPGILPFPLLPLEKVFYSSDLEDDWRKNSKPFDIQVPRKNSLKFRAPQKRPCSFYLEGNCRRSDCKFSHDLASITCRFWEEGSCFKGITCPFLHGYPNESDCFFRVSPTSDCSFLLESEADFPSLANSSVTDVETDVLLKERKDGKSSHVKRKRGKPHPIQTLTQPSSLP